MSSPTEERKLPIAVEDILGRLENRLEAIYSAVSGLRDHPPAASGVMTWDRPDGGQVCYITGDREACMVRFTCSLEPGEHLLAVPEGSRVPGRPSISECFMGGALEGLLDLHTFGTVVGPLDPDRGA